MRILFSLLLLSALSANAQNISGDHHSAQMPHTTFSDDPVNHRTHAQNSGIAIHQSPEIQMLSNRFKAEHQGKNDIKGFRVQVFVGDRSKAGEMKAHVSELYPDLPVEINYLAPNFRVRVGNFRTNLDADRFLRQLKIDFPNAYVVPDEIALPALW